MEGVGGVDLGFPANFGRHQRDAVIIGSQMVGYKCANSGGTVRIPALMVAVLMLAGAVGSANPPQSSPFREPRNVSDVLEACGEAVNKPTPPPGVADKGYMSICLPPDTRTQDLIRVIVKGLQGLPTQLHEPKNGPVKEVLKKAYPCPAPAPEDAKPSDAKP
jgi:hypothetical protein